MKSFTFRGERKPWLILSANKNKVPFPSITRNTIQIPGVDGALLTSSKLEPIVIEQPVRFIVESDEEALRMIDELASWLYTEAPAALQFDDEPGRTYYAVVQNTMEDFEKMVRVVRTGTIQFLCLDPHAYSSMIHHNLTSNSFIMNEGTAETYPSFEINVKRYITELSITNRSLEGKPSIILGRSASVDGVAYKREELVMHDTMQSTQGWQNASVVDVGHIAGQMTTDREGFYAEDYGEDIIPHTWQGPSLQRGLGESLQDFRADIKIASWDTVGGTGMIDVYFRDANGNLITKIGFGDYWRDRSENYGRGQVGRWQDNNRMDAFADKRWVWEKFDGIMRVERVGNVYSFYFARINENGEHTARHGRLKYVDSENKYSAPIASVQVAFRKVATYPRMKLRIKEIKVYRINNLTSSISSPFIAEPGDIIMVDNESSEVTINGEYANHLASLESDFFKLQKGFNQFEIAPNDAAQIYAMYRRAYL